MINFEEGAAKVKALNYDHHERMTRDYHARKQDDNKAIRQVDEDSFKMLLDNVPKDRVNGEIKVLELGASNGNIFPYVANYFGIPLGQIYGIDVFEPEVEQGKQLGYQLVTGVVEKLPYADNTFDVVFSRHVMEHTFDVRLTMNEIYRVLKTGGYVAALTPAYHPDPEPAHIQQHSLEKWVEFYKENGFTVISSYSHSANCAESHVISQK